MFVEEFILERTLEPAINEFGLKELKMIDPACGSGHFLLGAFARILAHWRKQEPGTSGRELVNRALASVHGVDLNPYAVAIARFRLLVAAMRECHITTLKDAPAFAFNLACGDSLLHGPRFVPGDTGTAGAQSEFGFGSLAHCYAVEDPELLGRILMPGRYHAVVANPPYITVKDRSLNEAYRQRYHQVCHMKYSLAVPFMQRVFVLACDSGFTGQITANSFMKREFGKKVVEGFLPKLDLTHVIDTRCVHLPEHGTSTVIILGRQRAPTANSVRVLSTLKTEEPKPAIPEQGKVWLALVSQVDIVGSQSEYVTVANMAREQFAKHPWSIGGGGAAELKEMLDEAASAGSGTTLGALAESVGITCFTLADDFFFADRAVIQRRGIGATAIRGVVIGDDVRDWYASNTESLLFPYDDEYKPVRLDVSTALSRFLWRGRTVLGNNKMFGGKTKVESGLLWYEYGRLTHHKLKTPLSITFANVATHNHFVLDRGGRIFECHAPVVKLPACATEDEHLALLGLLNSSVACFWMKQVFYDKGGGGISEGVKAEAWERFYEHDGTKLRRLPLPVAAFVGGTESDQAGARTFSPALVAAARRLDSLARMRAASLPSAICSRTTTPNRSLLDAARAKAKGLFHEMVARQEELDWLCYRIFGLIEGTQAEHAAPPGLHPGERSFEMVMARRMSGGHLSSEWLRRHNGAPCTAPPPHWPQDYRQVVERRITVIEDGPAQNKDIALIEQPEHKRRWNIDAWEDQERRALGRWLLDRLENCFDLDGRMNDAKQARAHGTLRQPRLTSVAQVADLARQDNDFMQVAELYADRMDFDVGNLVGELVAAESVPALPVLRYKPSGLDKRKAWERTWDLQRAEDAIDALFTDVLNAKARRREEEEKIKQTPWLHDFVLKDEWAEVEKELVGAAAHIADAIKQNSDPNSELVTKAIQDYARRAKKAVIGDIAVPPKYTSADFLSGDYWRLRGKLDVPKERWVSFPHCEGEDGTLVIAWAGYDHLQLARAIAERYELAKEQEGRKLVPLLAAIGQLIPWLKQWHNELDPTYGTRMGDYFENYLAEEAKALPIRTPPRLAHRSLLTGATLQGTRPGPTRFAKAPTIGSNDCLTVAAWTCTSIRPRAAAAEAPLRVAPRAAARREALPVVPVTCLPLYPGPRLTAISSTTPFLPSTT